MLETEREGLVVAMPSLKSLLPKHMRTSRLVLELFNYSTPHYACLLASMNTPTAHRNMGDFGITAPEAFDELNLATRLSPSVFPQPVQVDIDVYCIMRLGDENGPLMGGVSIAQPGADVSPDLGWCALEGFHGKGYASEAARELLRMVQQDLEIKNVIAWPGASNSSNIAVAERVGFVVGATAKDENGRDCIVYVLPGMSIDKGLKLSLYGH